MAPSAPAAPLIKGYLPIRIRIPNKDSTTRAGEDEEESSSSEQQYEDTFMYVKEHQVSAASSHNDDDDNSDPTQQSQQKGCTLFVANTPIIPGIQRRLLLKSIMGRFGEVVRVTIVPNPRKSKAEQSETIASWTRKFVKPSFLPKIDTGKFAHVVLKSPKELKKTLKHLTRVMSGTDDDALPAVVLDPIELQTLADESERQLRKEHQRGDSDDEDNDDDSSSGEHERKGILAVAHLYRTSCAQAMNRAALMQECNDAMQNWEGTQEELRQARQAAANEPDDDGFVTVTYGHNEVQAELTAGDNNKKRRGNKIQRNRSAKKAKKNTLGGAGPLQDFYRFQAKEHRKKNLHELRERFEQDLKKVKQLKEEKQYRPFG